MSALRPAAPYAAVVGPVVVAHRGGALEAPENTLAAIEHALAAGADWIEIDVTLSKDGAVVVIHDDTLERTTSGVGRVADHTVKQLKELQISAGERMQHIPTLHEALAVEAARFMVELKRVARPEKLAEAVLQVLREVAAQDRVMIGSFETDLLWAVHHREPSLPLIGIASSVVELEQMLHLPLAAVAVHKDMVAQALAHTPAGVAVWVWTLYTLDEVEELTLSGVHGLITDIPQAAVAALRSPPDPQLELSR